MLNQVREALPPRDPGGQPAGLGLLPAGSMGFGGAAWGTTVLQSGASWQTALKRKHPCAPANHINIYMCFAAEQAK